MNKKLEDVLREIADLKEHGLLNDLDDSHIEACTMCLLSIFGAKVTWDVAKKITKKSDSALSSALSRRKIIPEKVRRVPIDVCLKIRDKKM